MVLGPVRAANMPNPELITVKSSYRTILSPLMDYVLKLEDDNPGRKIAVLLPELVVRRWWENLLHNQRVQILKLHASCSREISASSWSTSPGICNLTANPTTPHHDRPPGRSRMDEGSSVFVSVRRLGAAAISKKIATISRCDWLDLAVSFTLQTFFSEQFKLDGF